jgi:hypothetical protein
MAKLMGGPDVMFVCLVALVDATRDAIKSVMLQSEGHDRDGVDGIIVMSIILVAMNITVLIVSILRDRGSIKVEMLDWDGFQRTFLVAALLFSWFMKSRAKYFEEKGEGNRGLLTSPVEPKAD